jgi:hypothetical protein
MPRPDIWTGIIDQAAEIAGSYDVQVTLRQLFYRLVAAGTIKNSQGQYNQLSRKTAALRREGRFPSLAEGGRRVTVAQSWDGAENAVGWLARNYRRDRTEGQEYTIVLLVEKNALGGLLWSWFGDLGVPVVALGGVASETIERKVSQLVEDSGRPAVGIYAGDFDATGTNMDRVFMENTGCWDEWQRIALNEDQVMSWGLPVFYGKAGDPNARRFIEAHPAAHEVMGTGIPVQVELDAIDPPDLRGLYQAEIDLWHDAEAYADVLEREREEREILEGLAA